ncbi:MAG TPA: DNA polymerase III subunit gamma/tau [Vicinamibacterales bacterium]|nr:DNA polymerase III subunit gamma/tau [Vicinamibacterales bacterium]
MSYQVIARKWRPQRFDDVVGQQAVTRTLRNALKSGRLAQAFVFAGPRGVGKTTTARILARALNCVNGPTPDPCGECDACVEIAQGRDIDVLEIDAATNTQVEKVREIIIEGLGIMPVRNRYKVFIVDEVHQLSSHSFNALLKSIEEPPPHAVFMMATTELDKIPETILSRSQVYEFRMISTQAIARQLEAICQAEQIVVDDESLQLIARDADGSMRDAQSKLDQVIAFTGSTITADDVGTVLGLVGRDMLFNTLQAVADEDAVQAFVLAGRAVEMGYDLRLVCRELARVVRDLLVLSVDPSRAADPEIAGEGERDRLLDLVKRFSREDLLRSFDLLTRAENDIRGAAQPRYHLEMALLRWIHQRKLVAIEDLIQSAGSGQAMPGRPALSSGPARAASAAPAPSPVRAASPVTVPAAARVVPPAPARPSIGVSGRAEGAPPARASASAAAATAPARVLGADEFPALPASGALGGSALKDAVLAEARRSSSMMYNTVLIQAQRIEVLGDRLVLTFASSFKFGPAFEKYRTALEAIATRLAGRRIAVEADGTGAETAAPDAPARPAVNVEKQAALKEQAMADTGVQALLEVFPAEIRDVEEM